MVLGEIQTCRYMELMSSTYTMEIPKEMRIGCSSHWIQSSKEKDTFITLCLMWCETRNSLTLNHRFAHSPKHLYKEYLHYFCLDFLINDVGITSCWLDRFHMGNKLMLISTSRQDFVCFGPFACSII